jgi:hypothetical protein
MWYSLPWESQISSFKLLTTIHIQHSCSNWISHFEWTQWNKHDALSLTLSLLMSYVDGAPCKARNFNIVYIYGLRFDNALSICCTMFQHWINAESYPVAQLCVNPLQYFLNEFIVLLNGVNRLIIQVNRPTLFMPACSLEPDKAAALITISHG